jgi:hypothetical protein
MVARRHFRTLVLWEGDPLYGPALKAGYAVVPGVADSSEIPERVLQVPTGGGTGPRP